MRVVLLVLVIISSIYAETQTVLKQTGDMLELGCYATGVIEWKVDGGPTTDGVKSTSAEGRWNSTLKKMDLQLSDAGSYLCYTSEDDSVISNYTVTVISLSGDSERLDVNASQTELKCEVSNTDVDVTSISWMRAGEMINATDKYKISKSNDSHSSIITVVKPVIEDVGVYNCVVTVSGVDRSFNKELSLDTEPVVQNFGKLRSKVEGEDAMIVCNVTGYPVPVIAWYRQLEDQAERQKVVYDERVNSTESDDGVPHAKLIIKKLKIKTDRGDYTCEASNSFGSDEKMVSLKVKDKLAAVWPFLGICAEVAILCSIIFIFEKRRNRRMEEAEEVDAVKQNLMNQSNGNDEVRQRNNAVKA